MNRGKTIPIRASDGGSFSGYLAAPSSGTGPGLLILQEIFGVNAHIRAVVERYAEEGYVTMAPDLFWRMQPNVDLGFTPDEFVRAREFGNRFDADRGVADIGAALETLRAYPG